MCRLVAYLGHDVLLEDVLVKPVNSIIMQSLHARESEIPTNGDGFGLGWYAPTISPLPALFTSISPAWNDRNLLNLTAKIKAPCFFAHVRAASAGGVTHYNCHPFIYQQWMMMHNGEIDNFMLVKRHIRHLLDDDIYNWIRGETDSEHLFALFLQLAKGKDLAQISIVADVLEEAFKVISQLIQKFSKHDTSFFNICLTDGKRVIASRYCTNKKKVPETMHYSIGSGFVARGGKYHMSQEGHKHECVLISSEKLTDIEADWHDVPANQLLMIDSDLTAQLRPITK